MQALAEFLKALTIIAPLIEEVIACLRGGPEPDFMHSLPATLKSRVALELRKAKVQS